MTAVTEAELREAALDQWSQRWRLDEDRIRLWPGQGLHDLLSDLVYMEFAEGTSRTFWALTEGQNDIGLAKDRLLDEALGPVVAAFEAGIVEALVGAMLTFAAEYPDAPRRAREAVPA